MPLWFHVDEWAKAHGKAPWEVENHDDLYIWLVRQGAVNEARKALADPVPGTAPKPDDGVTRF